MRSLIVADLTHLGLGFQPSVKGCAANLISDGNDAYYNANC